MRPFTLAAAALVVGVLLAISGSTASAAPDGAGGKPIVVQNHAVYSLNAAGGRLHRLFSTPVKETPVAASHTGGVIAALDGAHGWGYPDVVDYGVVISDLHGHSHRIGYGDTVVLSDDGKWAAITGDDTTCNKVSKNQYAPNPCAALTITRTDGSAVGRRVFDGFHAQVAGFSRDGSQLAIVRAVNRKLSRLSFITRDGRKVGRTFTLPLGDEVFVQQGDWLPGRIVLSASTQFGDGYLYDLNTKTGTVWSRGTPYTPEIWLNRGGSEAVLGAVISYKGDPGGVPGGGFIADTLDDYKTWGEAVDQWVNQQADESTVPALHPLYVSKRPFAVIGWAW